MNQKIQLYTLRDRQALRHAHDQTHTPPALFLISPSRLNLFEKNKKQYKKRSPTQIYSRV